MKKNKMKITAAATGAILALSAFAGCGAKIADDENTLEIYATSAGYGIEWLYDLEKVFEKQNPGCNVEITYDVGVELAENKIKSGPKVTTADLFFSLEDWNTLVLSGSNGVAGYDCALEDLTAFIDEKDENGESLRDKLAPELIKSLSIETETSKGSGEYEDRVYALPWASAATGIVYNKDMFETRGWELPRTTNELIVLADKVKDAGLIAFANESQTGYIGYLAQAMFAQYAGAEEYDEFYSPVTEDDWKMYSADPSKAGEFYYGRLYSAEVMEQICCLDFGRMSEYVTQDGYERAQGRLVSAQAAMSINGDWFDNEMSVAIQGAHEAGNNYTSGMMKTPVISALSDQLSYWKKLLPSHATYTAAKAADGTETTETLKLCDELLAGLVDYVDGKTQELPSVTYAGTKITATAADAARVKAARGVYNSLGSGHTIVIPAYATAKEAAKKFIRLLYSDTGIEAFLTRTKGGIMPVKYDVSKWEGYSSATQLQKDIYDIVESGSPIKFMDGLFYGLPRVPSDFYLYSRSNEKYETPRQQVEKTSMEREAYIEFMMNLGLL